MSEQEYLFVYGTLRRGVKHPMAGLLARHADFIGSGSFQGQLYDLGGYPGLVLSSKISDVVVGDVYALRNPEPLFETLDHYEGYLPGQPASSIYLRTEVRISLDKGGHLQAWIYVYNAPIKRFKQIEPGDYLEYLRRQPNAARILSTFWLRVQRRASRAFQLIRSRSQPR